MHLMLRLYTVIFAGAKGAPCTPISIGVQGAWMAHQAGKGINIYRQIPHDLRYRDPLALLLPLPAGR